MVILLSCATAIYPNQSWGYLFDFFSWLVIYFLIIHTVTTRARLVIFVTIFLIASFKLSLFGARTWATRGFCLHDLGHHGSAGVLPELGRATASRCSCSRASATTVVQFLKPHVSKLKYYVLLLMPLTAAMTVMGASSRGGQIGLLYQSYRAILKERLSFKTIIHRGDRAECRLVPVAGRAEGALHRSRLRSVLEQRAAVLEARHRDGQGTSVPRASVTSISHRITRLIIPRTCSTPSPSCRTTSSSRWRRIRGSRGLFLYRMIIYRNIRSTRDVEKLCQKHSLQHEIYIPLAKGLRLATWGFVIAGQFVSVVYYPFLWINLAFAVCLHNIVERATRKSPAWHPRGQPAAARMSALDRTRVARKMSFWLPADTWTDLVGRSRANPLFMGWEWQATWWRTHGVPMPAKLKVLAVYAGPQLVGLAPFYQHTVRWQEVLPIVRMECLGHAWRRHGPDFGEYLDFIVDRDYEAQVLPQLFNHIVRDPSWGEIVISNSPSTGIAVDLFGRALREQRVFRAHGRRAAELSARARQAPSMRILKRLDGGVRRKLWAGRKKLPDLEVRSFGAGRDRRRLRQAQRVPRRALELAALRGPATHVPRNARAAAGGSRWPSRCPRCTWAAS